MVLRLALVVLVIPAWMLTGCHTPSTMVATESFKGITPVVAAVPSHYRFFQGLVINQTITESRFPILPYIFFDSASTSIPKRYYLFTDTEQTNAFSDTTAAGDHIAWHHHVLNVIGYRMRRYPATSITITGCASRVRGQRERAQTVERRAEVIRDYLIGIWSVDPSRIRLRAPRDLPIPDSDSGDQSVSEENRRVEIASSDYDLLKPIVFRDVRLYPAPSGMRFRLRNPIADSLVESRSIELRRGGLLWSTVAGIGRRDTLTQEILWGRNGSRDTIPIDEAPYVARLFVTDVQGHQYRSDTALIPVEIVDIQKRLRYGQTRATIEVFMLLFPDSAGIGPVTERFMRERILPIIDSASHIQIVGGGDYPLEARQTNQMEIARRAQRARRNAEAVSTGLKRMLGDAPAEIAVGSPAVDPLYRGRTPEERFYLRAVTVRIVTPATK